MGREGEGINYRSGQGRSAELSRAIGGLNYPESGQLNLSVAGCVIEVDGLGGIITRERSGVREVEIDGDDLVVHFDRRQPSNVYYADAQQLLRGGGLPEPIFLGVEPSFSRAIIRGVDVAGAQVDLGGREPAIFRFRAERRIAR